MLIACGDSPPFLVRVLALAASFFCAYCRAAYLGVLSGVFTGASTTHEQTVRFICVQAALCLIFAAET